MLTALVSWCWRPVVATIVAIALTHAYFRARQGRKSQQATGSLTELPGDASSIDAFNSDPTGSFLELAHRWGHTFMLHVGGVVEQTYGLPQVVATCDPAIVKEVLRGKMHNAHRPLRYRQGMVVPGLAGILWMEGEQWTRHTKALKPTFQHPSFSGYARFLHDAACRHIATAWRSEASASPGDKRPHEVPNLINSLRELATEMMLGAGCGVDPTTASGAALRDALRGYDEKKRLRVAKGACAVPAFLRGMMQLYFDAQRIKHATRAAVLQRAAQPTARAPHSEDDGKEQGEKRVSQDWLEGMTNAGMTEKEIFNEINHLHGAHKAIAIVTAFALYELAKHPKWQQTVRDELTAVLGGRPHPGRKDLGALSNTMLVWKETLRMHPIALGVLRETGAPLDVKLRSEDPAAPSKTTTLPAGTPIVLLLQALHFHPDFWDQPELFNPARWAEEPSAMRTNSDRGVPGAFVPFLDGQRQCAGRFLAELEFAVVLHAVLSQFDVAVPPDYCPVLLPDVYPTLKDPLPLILHPLK